MAELLGHFPMGRQVVVRQLKLRSQPGGRFHRNRAGAELLDHPLQRRLCRSCPRLRSRLRGRGHDHQDRQEPARHAPVPAIGQDPVPGPVVDEAGVGVACGGMPCSFSRTAAGITWSRPAWSCIMASSCNAMVRTAGNRPPIAP